MKKKSKPAKMRWRDRKCENCDGLGCSHCNGTGNDGQWEKVKPYFAK